MKGKRLWVKGKRLRVYGMKGVGLWEVSENLRPATDRIGIFSLKVIVYGRKGDK